MTPETEKIKAQIAELRASADRMENSVPSSQEWVSPERYTHYLEIARKKRQEADRLEASLAEGAR